MSAPTTDAPTVAPAPVSAGHSLPATRSEHKITPTQAGWAGAAVGLGAGLLFAEIVVPGVILAAIGLVGFAAWRNGTKAS